MKKERKDFIVDKFVDSKGVEHNFVICALSSEFENGAFIEAYGQNDSAYDCLRVVKALSLGISFCNASDTFNEELGKTIAEGRARKHPERVMFSTHSGMVNSMTVKALLKQEAEYLKSNPEQYIKGFKK